MPSYRGVAQLVARLLWALSATAAGGGNREHEKAQRSKVGEAIASNEFREPQEGGPKQHRKGGMDNKREEIEVWRSW